ncbi:MAG: acetyl-CoA C-acetyltransferase [bacterium]
MPEAVIVSACRTPLGAFKGALSHLAAPQLAAIVLNDLLRRAGVPHEQVEEVILGQVFQAGIGQHPARQAALAAGLPESVSTFAVNKMCGSGLLAVGLAARAIAAADRQIVLAGGMESMSRAPYLLDQARNGYRLGHGELVDCLIRDGLWDVYDQCHMGLLAEQLAAEFAISRADQDAYAAASQHRFTEAQKNGLFKSEITPISIPQRKGAPILFDSDECPRPETTLERLAALKPVFKSDGTITAGNSSCLGDGAAGVLVLSAARARELKLTPLASIRSWASVGLKPARMGLGPVSAATQALNQSGLKLADMDLVEVNEAFAAQVLAVRSGLAWDPARVNVNGGAIALGHPLGASGARILVTLLHELQHRQARYGLAALCIGGGEGIAMVVERWTGDAL